VANALLINDLSIVASQARKIEAENGRKNRPGNWHKNEWLFDVSILDFQIKQAVLAM
jgi:hypothetical protein